MVKKHIAFSFFVLGLIVSGCGASVHRINYNQHYPPKSVNCVLDIYYPSQKISKHAISIGEASALEAGLTTNCGQSQMIDKVREQGCLAGADAMKIVEIMPPNLLGSSCYQVKAALLKYDEFGSIPTSPSGNVVSAQPYQPSEELEAAQEKVRHNPDDANAHYKLGTRYIQIKRYNEAIAALKEAIRIKPDYAVAHYNLGLVFFFLNQWEESNAAYKKAIRINPEFAEAYINLATNYLDLQRHEEAIVTLKKAIRLKPLFSDELNFKRDLNINFGVAYEGLGKYQDAIVEYQEALRIDPNSTLARNKLSKLKQKKAQARPSPPINQSTPQPSAKQQTESGGTGFLFSSKDYVITNYHVVKGASSISAKFTNGQMVDAELVASDPKNDIAILKLAKTPPLSASPIKLGDSSQARMGEKIFTIGYPASKIMGEKPKYSEGVINSMTGLKDDPAFFQVSVPVQPGNSGGPLFNERGEVIGITTASLSLLAIDAFGAIPQNVNYAIKASFVKNLLSTIPELMLSNTGIVVIPNEPENSLPNFIEQASKNIVLIEAKK